MVRRTGEGVPPPFFAQVFILGSLAPQERCKGGRGVFRNRRWLRGRWGVLQQLDSKRRANTRRREREFPTGQQIGRRIRRRAGRSAVRRALLTASGRTASMFYFTARVNSLTWRGQSWAKKPRLEMGTRKCDTQSLLSVTAHLVR